MTSEEFKSKIGDILGGYSGRISEKMLASHLGVSIQDVCRFKKGKLPARYRRDDILDKLRRTWVHYEGTTENENPVLEMRKKS